MGCVFPEANDTKEYWENIKSGKQFIKESTVGNVAAFVLEPVQGWGGSIFPPDDFFPKLRKLCDDMGILLMDDEVLAGMGRTGKWLCMEHWDVQPDIVTLGKSFGNGFPVLQNSGPDGLYAVILRVQ